MEALIHELNSYETVRLVNLLKETKYLEDSGDNIFISMLSDDMKFLVNLNETSMGDIYDNIDVITDILGHVILTKIINDKF